MAKSKKPKHDDLDPVANAKKYQVPMKLHVLRERLVLVLRKELFEVISKACCDASGIDISFSSPTDPRQAEMINARCGMGSRDVPSVQWDEFGRVTACLYVMQGRVVLELPSRRLFNDVRDWLGTDRDIAFALEGSAGAGAATAHEAEMVNARCAAPIVASGPRAEIVNARCVTSTISDTRLAEMINARCASDGRRAEMINARCASSSAPEPRRAEMINARCASPGSGDSLSPEPGETDH